MNSQNQRVLERLRRGPLTQLQAYDELGITRLGARVFELKDEGHLITSEMVTVKNRHGDDCRVAQYNLTLKPDRNGLYPADSWRESNPGYQQTPPRRVRINGVECIEVDGGLVYDASRLGRGESNEQGGGGCKRKKPKS